MTELRIYDADLDEYRLATQVDLVCYQHITNACTNGALFIVKEMSQSGELEVTIGEEE